MDISLNRAKWILGKKAGCKDIEIKVALETNKPKGHLVKPGPHVIVRYVLAQENGFIPGKDNRGKIAWIWEVRVGNLKDSHFNCSNTDGDSGKTAVINASGMDSLNIVYCDLDHCPLPKKGQSFENLKKIFGG